MTDTDTHTEVDLGALVQTQADLGEALAWLAENWHGLPKPYPQVESDYDAGRHTLTLRAQFGWATEATLADGARRLAVGAPLGAVTKHHKGNYVHVRRAFGSVVIECWSSRERVCVRKQVGTKTVEIPDPNVQVPTVTVDQPIYEWDCTEPLLAVNDQDPAVEQ